MTAAPDIWVVVPVKEMTGSKQRLAARLTAEQRRVLAATMLDDVLDALRETRGVAGIMLVTVDPDAAERAARIGARVLAEGARDGHTGAVSAAARVLAAEGRAGMLTLPGDIPAITAAEVQALLAAHAPAPAVTIAPAHDRRGSNAVLCSPPDALALRFGDDSFLPHLAAARQRGIQPTVLALSGIGMDIDHPADLTAFLDRHPRRATRTDALLAGFGLPATTDGTP